MREAKRNTEPPLGSGGGRQGDQACSGGGERTPAVAGPQPGEGGLASVAEPPTARIKHREPQRPQRKQR